MKSVLISIQPKWCELIASGKKTVEVRKTRPKIDVPFKCYIYETRGKSDRPILLDFGVLDFHGRGQVIGEFMCYAIETVSWISNPQKSNWREHYNEETCLTNTETYEYTKGNIFYEWHISDLVIYDEPKELSEFRKECKLDCDMRFLNEPPCEKCEHLVASFGCGRTIIRPPQSWCYVERKEYKESERL